MSKRRIKLALAQTMKEYGISQTALAKASGVKQPQISAYLSPHNDKKIEDDTLEKLISALPSQARLYFLIQGFATKDDVPGIMRSLAELLEETRTIETSDFAVMAQVQ